MIARYGLRLALALALLELAALTTACSSDEQAAPPVDSGERADGPASFCELKYGKSTLREPPTLSFPAGNNALPELKGGFIVPGRYYPVQDGSICDCSRPTTYVRFALQFRADGSYDMRERTGSLDPRLSRLCGQYRVDGAARTIQFDYYGDNATDIQLTGGFAPRPIPYEAVDTTLKLIVETQQSLDVNTHVLVVLRRE
jgi:hypothetical protein